ncbi:MAG TPA: hypothetical protein VMT34_05575 [Aggregatilineales bacterium]|nr:hypothetical protein [Aggregatilineales bacterium]
MLDLLLPFGEAALLITPDRCVKEAAGATETIFAVPPQALVGQRWEEPPVDSTRRSLHWAIEATAEGYVAPRFLPSIVPFDDSYVAKLSYLSGKRLLIRLSPSHEPPLRAFVGTKIRPALTSVSGFTDVLRKGIDGPLTDTQIEDLDTIDLDARMALVWLDDLLARHVLPTLVGPLPVLLHALLALTPDDLPRRHLAQNHVTLAMDLPDAVPVYSSRIFRSNVAGLIHMLSREAAQGSQITLTTATDARDEELNVMVNYRPTQDNPVGHLEPVDTFGGAEVHRAQKLLALISSLQARLSPYQCRAWADSDPGSTTVTLTIPRWYGPL